MSSATLLTLGILIFLVPAARPQEEMSYAQIILSSRCRAVCIGTFVQDSQSDAECLHNTNCYKCWEMCENLIQPAWQYLCLEEQKHVCNDGCQVACAAMTKPGDDQTVDIDAELWAFPALPTYSVVSDTLLEVKWMEVEQADPQRGHGDHQGGHADPKQGPSAVYTLMWTFDDVDTWSPVCTTSELWAEVSGAHYQYPGLSFLLLAVSSDGVVAEASPVHLPPVQMSDHQVQERKSLSVKVTLVEASLQATLALSLPAGERPGIYHVQVGREDCECEGASDHKEYAIEPYMDPHKETLFDLEGLTYNSKYWVEVQLSHGVAIRMYFYTPQCDIPDHRCTVCQQPAKVFQALNTIQTNREPLVGHVSLFTVVGFCLASVTAVITVGVLMTYKHKQLTALLSAQTQALRKRATTFKESFRSKASSLRSKLSRDSSRKSVPYDLEGGLHPGLSLILHRSPVPNSIGTCQQSPPSTPDSLLGNSYSLSALSSFEEELELDDSVQESIHGVLELDLSGF